MTIQIDPEFRALIPALTKDELKQLEANLKTDGCRDPLVVWKGQGLLLDGHHRFEICTKEQLKYQTVEVSCADRDDAKAWIIRQQFGRRNLQPFQRAELALALKPLMAIEAKRRQAATQLVGKGKQRNPMVVPNSGRPLKSNEKTDAKLAQVAGIGKDAIHRTAVIKAHAAPEVQQALREGKTTINRVYTNLKKDASAPTFDGRQTLQDIEQLVTSRWAICTAVWRVRFLEHGRLLYERLAKEEAQQRKNGKSISIEFDLRKKTRAQ